MLAEVCKLLCQPNKIPEGWMRPQVQQFFLFCWIFSEWKGGTERGKAEKRETEW